MLEEFQKKIPERIAPGFFEGILEKFPKKLP